MAYKKAKYESNKAQDILQSLIKKIEEGVPPWKCGWERSGGSGMPRNIKTGQDYRGINILTLWYEQAEFGYSTSNWIGFNQAKELGGYIRKNEKGHNAIKVNTINKKDSEGNETGEVFQLPMTVTVFNLDQCEGLDHLRPDTTKHEWEPIDRAEALMVESGATFQYGGDRAFYAPTPDKIQLPVRESFLSAEDFYATSIHELGHWTGHKSRLDREFGKKFGTEAYAFEELVAEISCAIVKARIGLEGDVVNHASYLESWLKVLQKHPGYLITAASAASKAADYLTKNEPE